MNELQTDLMHLLDEARHVLSEAADEAAVEECRIRFSGRKGSLPGLMKRMGSVAADERPATGKTLNEVKQGLQAALDEATRRVASGSVSADAIDVTLPGRKRRVGGMHPVTRIMDEAVSIFRRLGFVVADGPDLDTVYHNFDALNTPADHPSRDMQDTFYLADGRLLRTQTSPVQIRVMEGREPPIRIICPGRCYRRDTPDATHSMNFHQIEGLYIDHDVSMADLKGVVAEFAREMLGPGTDVRFRPHFFPFTEPSIEFDFTCVVCKGKGCRVCKGSGWIEIAGAGMVDPNVLRNVGYDPEEWSGYAFGMGIERIAMICLGINDIRLIYENDMRFLAQF
ncbi:MAG: phenylalanine--tRNA ligase subunit alpha [Victivallales bacterium]|nr:phenylalanine--tRNA ligase subunit alpha [Victivallales bacterium]MBT7162660.1 phenylalanine--tRNA ligase subunit alpha [Victivallales bacterium]